MHSPIRRRSQHHHASFPRLDQALTDSVQPPTTPEASTSPSPPRLATLCAVSSRRGTDPPQSSACPDAQEGRGSKKLRPFFFRGKRGASMPVDTPAQTGERFDRGPTRFSAHAFDRNARVRAQWTSTRSNISCQPSALWRQLPCAFAVVADWSGSPTACRRPCPHGGSFPSVSTAVAAVLGLVSLPRQSHLNGHPSRTGSA
jgi:hypothetical protein